MAPPRCLPPPAAGLRLARSSPLRASRREPASKADTDNTSVTNWDAEGQVLYQLKQTGGGRRPMAAAGTWLGTPTVDMSWWPTA
ncbi:unnamed protein product [Prorocentrum cordatum]|uniref:Uncharacterized protein n=1 Tax=Prorocentrum cordatum TaxID=2364126 RepID=A0ABN9RMD4_9DINO|nr:unnamed protein product [Polarella glacialis]